MADSKKYQVVGSFVGPPGPAGSDATVTAESVKNALGYVPASQDDVDTLSDQIANDGGGGASVYIGDTQPTDGTLYWLDTSEDTEPEEPDTPVEPVVYKITANLTNCTSNNSATSINEGESYTTTLTASDGYQLSSVSITMGGTDVTSTVYADGIVTVDTVTGDVVITATAVLAESGGTVTVEIPNVAEEIKTGYRVLGPSTSTPKFQEAETQTCYKITNVKAGDVITTVNINASDSVAWIEGVGVINNSDSRVTIGSFVDNYSGRMYTLVADTDYATVWVNALTKCVITGRVTWTKSADSGESGSGGDTEVTLSSISATYTGGDVAVGTALTDLTGITVTGTYSDGSTATITGYTLSGTIAEGSNTITVSYSGKTTAITVTGVAESGGDTEENPNLAESNICTVGEVVASNTARKFTTTELQSLLDAGYTDLYCVGYRSNSQYGFNFKISANFTSDGGMYNLQNATNTPDGIIMTDFIAVANVLTDSPYKAVGKFSIQGLLSKLNELISDGTLDPTERYGTNTISISTTSPVTLDNVLYSYDPNYKV